MKDFLYRMQVKMSRFMYGRNGQDHLGRACYIAGLIILIVSLFTRQFWLYYVTIAFLGYSIFRMLSKNLSQRQKENMWFLRKTGSVKKWFRVQKMRWKDRKVSRYFKCTKCKQMIRVPVKRGKIEITCPKCRNTFIRRT